MPPLHCWMFPVGLAAGQPAFTSLSSFVGAAAPPTSFLDVDGFLLNCVVCSVLMLAVWRLRYGGVVVLDKGVAAGFAWFNVMCLLLGLGHVLGYIDFYLVCPNLGLIRPWWAWPCFIFFELQRSGPCPMVFWASPNRWFSFLSNPWLDSPYPPPS